MEQKYDFKGWATRANIKCSDGRIITKDAFKHNDGEKVPLVWNHQHNDPSNVLGHAYLENRPEGVYAYGVFNDTEAGRSAKELVQHGDIDRLSIFANRLKHNGPNVTHGVIREVSLVLAGANPGAMIDSIIKHADGEEEANIFFNENSIDLKHADDSAINLEETKPEPKQTKGDEKMKEKTVGDVFEELTEEQKTAVYAIIGQIMDDKEGELEDMKHNLFDSEDMKDDTLSHDDMKQIIADGKKYGSMKESFLEHGITDIEYLFPDAKTLDGAPGFITRQQDWVEEVMKGTRKTPFARIKSVFANLTAEEARAKGYVKGKLKKEQVFSLLKRTTTPTTIYKKQKLDRDDIIDITDFDVIAWIKTEMRMMLNEEIARCVLVGDGRLSSSEEKVPETNIRPIYTDEELYTISKQIKLPNGVSEDDKAKAIIRAAVKARKDYKGAGNPTFFTTEELLTDMLLMEDKQGRVIYDTIEKLATALRCKKIVTVPVMEGLSRTLTDDATQAELSFDLAGLIVNLHDYNVGADKGGEVNLFDDFDIDYNAQKYLIETRCSGALVTPYSAIALEVHVEAPAAQG